MREKQQERRSKRERETEGERFARVCVRARVSVASPRDGRVFIHKTRRRGASEGQACAAPLSRRIGACAPRGRGVKCFSSPSHVPVSSVVGLARSYRLLAFSLSLARSCVRACIRASVGPSNVLSFLSFSFSLSVAPLIPPGYLLCG